MKTQVPAVPWIRATCFGIGLILAVGGAYLLVCGAGLIAGGTYLPGVLNLLVGILLIQVASSLFRARRLLAAPFTTSLTRRRSQPPVASVGEGTSESAVAHLTR